MSSNGERARDRRLGAAAAALALAVTVVAAYAVHGSMPYNPIDLPAEQSLDTGAWAPEGWRFFTRDPEEETGLPYILDGSTWRRASVPSGSPRYLFGLDRAGRAQGIEMALLGQSIPAGAYRACEDEPETCLARTTTARADRIAVENHSPEPTLCGSIAIVLQKPVPWAWTRSGRHVVMPSRIARLEVTC